MRDIWYGDGRDLVKWSALFHLAEEHHAKRVLQIAYYRPSTFPTITMDGRRFDLPPDVINHFRDIRKIEGIKSKIRVSVLDLLFEDRVSYLAGAIKFIASFSQEKCLVFLDPDTGLEPERSPGVEHVLASEARAVWDSMKARDVFVFYQHQTNRNGQPWVEPKRIQLERALGLPCNSLKTASRTPKKKKSGLEIAPEVVFYCCEKH